MALDCTGRLLTFTRHERGHGLTGAPKTEAVMRSSSLESRTNTDTLTLLILPYRGSVAFPFTRAQDTFTHTLIHTYTFFLIPFTQTQDRDSHTHTSLLILTHRGSVASFLGRFQGKDSTAPSQTQGLQLMLPKQSPPPCSPCRCSSLLRLSGSQ